MGDFLLFMVIFWPFFFVFVFTFSNIIYPLFYSLPLSIYYSVRKEIRWRSVPHCAVAPVMWVLAMFGFQAFLGFLSAALNWVWIVTMFSHSAMGLAFYGAIAICAGKLILKRYRNEIAVEYFQNYYLKHSTEQNDIRLNEIVESFEEETDASLQLYAAGALPRSTMPFRHLAAITLCNRAQSNMSRGGAVDA
jgi:hypothetical protein